jgi:hypothetical protein
MARSLALLAALVASGRADAQRALFEPQPHRSPEEALERWMISVGGFLGGEIRTPPGRPRGVFATRDYEGAPLRSLRSPMPPARTPTHGAARLWGVGWGTHALTPGAGCR